VVRDKELLYNFKLGLMDSKLWSKWIGSSVVTNVFPYGVVEIKSESTDKSFKVNEHRLKSFLNNLFLWRQLWRRLPCLTPLLFSHHDSRSPFSFFLTFVTFIIFHLLIFDYLILMSVPHWDNV